MRREGMDTANLLKYENSQKDLGIMPDGRFP